MATSNRKDNHFFAIFHLFASLSRVSFGKKKKLYIRKSCENDFRQKFNLKKKKILSGRFLKSLFFLFLIKREKSLDKIFSKNDIVKKASIS